MIVVADTTPLISLMKIGLLNLAYQLFGEIQIPNAVYQELINNPRFPDESRQIARQMGIQLMGTIGILLAAYEEHLLSREEILKCIETLKNTGRHISTKLYEQLIKKLSENDS